LHKYTQLIPVSAKSFKWHYSEFVMYDVNIGRW